MEEVEKCSGFRRVSQRQCLDTRQMRGGYEPSNTETKCCVDNNGKDGDFGVQKPHLGLERARNESPWKLSCRSYSRYEVKNGVLAVQYPHSGLDETQKKSPLKLSGRSSSRYEDEPLSRNGEIRLENADLGSEQTAKLSRRKSVNFEDDLSSWPRASQFSPPRRRLSKSPYKPPRDDTLVRNFSQTEGRRHLSPHKPVREGHHLVTSGRVHSKRLENHRQANGISDKRAGNDQIIENSRVGEKSNYSCRSQSAPRLGYSHTEENGQRTAYPLPKMKDREVSHINTSSVGELNEMAANAKISSAPSNGVTNIEDTDSISHGDIFFSGEYTAMKMTLQNKVLPEKETHQHNKENGNFAHNNQRNSSSTVTQRTVASNSSFGKKSSVKVSTTNSSKLSGTSMNTVGVVAKRKKSLAELFFPCLKRGSCRTSKSPEKVKEFDEARFIEKAFVVEILRQFWADKYQSISLDGFTCHKQEAQSLKQLVSNDIFPHILLEGPQGSGKKALTRALLCEIFGKSAQNISHELRYFRIQDSRSTQAVVPVPSSAHHVELNVHTETNVRYALISLVKEISNKFAMTPETSLSIERTDYKVIVLYDIDKATESIQHLIKWIMDCYTESCKLILCSEEDEGILEPVKKRCKVIKVDAPVTHEIIEVLIQIAREEDFVLPMNIAAKIASKSRQNLRHAIMALEACKAHNYPFVDSQPIPIGWEEVVKDLAAQILADPNHTRIFSIRGRLQKLLVEFVHPKLILQGLVEQFLKAVEGRSRRELYYWHSYYEKRLPIGTTALLKLEEFVAKFMSIHRRGTLIDETSSSLTG